MHNQNRLLKVLKLISVLKALPPKSVKLLAKQLEISERSLYRYLDLLKEAGFEIKKDSGNKVFIEHNNNQIESVFTTEEAEFIKNTLLQSGSATILKNAVLAKLSLYSEIDEIGIDISQAQIGQIIKSIQMALENRTQVILKSYLSVNSNTVSDRRIEPIHFSADYTYVFGYEVESKNNKLFATDRIKEVKTTVVPFKFSKFHQFDGVDIFNFSNTGKTYTIDLILNVRSYALLKKEFPQVVNHIKTDIKNKQFHLQATVYNLKPIARFINGLPNEVTVLGSEELISFLKK